MANLLNIHNCKFVRQGSFEGEKQPLFPDMLPLPAKVKIMYARSQ